MEFLIDKTKLLDRLRGKLNGRQQKAILRMLEEGPDGFKGGLSAGNSDLVEQGALHRTGERRYARYRLNIPWGRPPGLRGIP